MRMTLSCIEPRIFIFLFIFLPTSSLGKVVGAAALGRLETPHDQQQSQIVLLAQHQDHLSGWDQASLEI